MEKLEKLPEISPEILPEIFLGVVTSREMVLACLRLARFRAGINCWCWRSCGDGNGGGGGGSDFNVFGDISVLSFDCAPAVTHALAEIETFVDGIETFFDGMEIFPDGMETFLDGMEIVPDPVLAGVRGLWSEVTKCAYIHT